MATISIIIPVYKVEKYLRRSLDSVLGQTFQDWQAVCVNDGSPDGCPAILEEYAARDPRFKVVDKPNGGLSDARNVGLDAADGEFVVFLDSDDFIHPQTLEIAYALARRNSSDVVSWYKDPNYRNICFVRHALGLDTIDFKPSGFRRRYSPEKVRYCADKDIFTHVTELSHPGASKKWPLKHFYVWRHLLRRELVKDIRFIGGITFEDFPWWSEVILKKPSVTITYLPFYYYYPNFSSIDLSSSRMKKVTNWCKGLDRCLEVYTGAGEYEKEMWSRNCKWPVITKQIAKHLGSFDRSSPEGSALAMLLGNLWDKEAFADPRDKAELKASQAIADFAGRS